MCGSACVTVLVLLRRFGCAGGGGGAVLQVGKETPVTVTLPATAVESVKPAHTESVEPLLKQMQAWASRS